MTTTLHHASRMDRPCAAQRHGLKLSCWSPPNGAKQGDAGSPYSVAQTRLQRCVMEGIVRRVGVAVVVRGVGVVRRVMKVFVVVR